MLDMEGEPKSTESEAIPTNEIWGVKDHEVRVNAECRDSHGSQQLV